EDECGMCDNCLSIDAEVEDMTVHTQKFLSCIARTNQKFGAYYIADILRGSSKKKILNNNHDDLSTYNIGNEWSKDQWILLGRMLVRQGYLKREEEYGSLKLTDQGRAVLNGKENVFGVLDRTDTVIGDKAIERTSSDVENDYDQDLFEQLHTKRKEMADQQGIPPYTIFPDTTLMEMAYYFPQSKENLLPIYGVGSVKQKKFGPTFLKIVTKYCSDHEIKEKDRQLQEKRKKTSAGNKFARIGKAFNDGQSIEHLCEEYGIKQITIVKHLNDDLEDGHDLRPEGIIEASNLSVRKQDAVMEIMEDIPPHMLRPIYDKLDKEVNYNELRVMQLYYMAQ